MVLLVISGAFGLFDKKIAIEVGGYDTNTVGEDMEIIVRMRLLVLLPGCTQNADDLARGSQMDRVADERGFLVLYPEQSVQANPRTCWNWFDAAHQSRDAGETGLLAALIAKVMSQYPVDTKRVRLAGISAGAACFAIALISLFFLYFATLTT